MTYTQFWMMSLNWICLKGLKCQDRIVHGVFYNNLDVLPFLEAIEKQHAI